MEAAVEELRNHLVWMREDMVRKVEFYKSLPIHEDKSRSAPEDFRRYVVQWAKIHKEYTEIVEYLSKSIK